MHHHLFGFLLGIGGCILFTSACTPTERNYGSGGLGGGGGNGIGGEMSSSTSSTSSSSSSTGGSAGAGGAMCPPDTADCNQDGACETNLLGDVEHCGSCNAPCMAPVGSVSKCVGGKCEYTCDVGTFDCDQNPMTACQDVMSDNKNCGACGHDCLGGMCMQGECQPVLAFDTQPVTGNVPVSLVVYGTDLYWGTTGGDVAKVSLDGSMFFMLGNVSGPVYGLAVTNDGAFATNGTRVSAFGLTGGLKWDSAGDQGVNSVAVGPAAVVWTATMAGRLRRADPTGSNQQSLSGMEQGPSTILLESGIARWVNTYTGEIRESVGLSMGNISTIYSTPPEARFLVHEGTAYYWVSSDSLYRGMGGMAPEPLFPVGADSRGLVADPKNLYWTVGNTGEVWRASRTSPYNPIPVAKSQAEPHAIAVAPDAIYWANRGDGKIMRLAR
ncbi:MAG TPA: hypothetical protein PK156_23675 [Polyangium sp.]|nr:hypothetical protein [Polyangium sp.]